MQRRRVEGERRGRRVAERRLKDVEIDKMEIQQLREKIMCTIIDKQFESPVWKRQIQNPQSPHILCLLLSFLSPQPPLINNYEQQCKHAQTLNLLSLSSHFFNLLRLYPLSPAIDNPFP